MAANAEKGDRFSSIIKLCSISPSQETKLLRCDFNRSSEFADDPSLSSSVEPTQADPTQVFMLSLPDTQVPAEEEPVFVTPPEQRLGSSSSGGNAGVDLKRARVRVSDDRELKKIRDSQDGDTVPVCDTEPIDGEIGAKCDVVVLDGDSGEKKMEVDLAEGKGIVQNGSGECRNVELGEGYRNTDGLSSRKIEVEKPNQVSGVNGDTGKGARVVSRNGRGASDKAFDEIDKFWYNGCGGDAARKRGGTKRQLPASIIGRQNGVAMKKSAVNDIVKILEMFDMDDERDSSEDVDFLATAKKQGLVFPRPRWWPAEGGDW